jgi:two-component system sensor histidine kinase CpxA
MRRLHVKIFLWFWLGVVVVSATLVTFTELAHSPAEDDRRWAAKFSPRVDMWARQETRVLRTGGAKALERYVGSFEADPGVANYVFDGSGADVLGRAVDPAVLRIVGSLAEAESGVQRVDHAERIIAEKVVDARGNPYVVVVDFPPPSIMARSLFEFLPGKSDGAGADTATLLRLVTVLGVAGVLCFLMARHIARPIDQLRAATRTIANEQLQTRVGSGVLQRKDEIGDLGRDFDRMAERIEHLVKAQRGLLADVSHALRSPLARVNLALGLARQRSDPAASEHLDRIERETERLNILIGQLLTMARVDSGVDLERQTLFDLASVVDEVATDADYEARSRHCRVELDHHDECPVHGAREVLRGAIENVVRNAVRYTAEQTTVQISTTRQVDADGASRAVIEVKDLGPGVPTDALGTLFAPFHRLAHGGLHSPDGSGLGLAITRRAFEVHGGTATAANRTDGGFVVTLKLPLAAVVS